MDVNIRAQLELFFRKFIELSENAQGSVMWLIADKYESEDDMPAIDSFAVRVIYENGLYHIDIIDNGEFINAYTIGPSFSLNDFYEAYNYNQKAIAYMDITTSTDPGMRHLIYSY